MQKQAREKPSARAAKRKKSSGSSGNEPPKETYWRRCVALVMAGPQATQALECSESKAEATSATSKHVTSLRADADVMAASMQSAYTAAFGSSKRRRLPDWIFGGSSNQTKAENSEELQTKATEKQKDMVDQDCEISEEEDEESLECNFCGKQGRGYGIRVYDADTFDAQMLCRSCATSYRTDWLDDGMEHPPLLCRQ